MKKEVINWCLAKAFLKKLFVVQNCHVSCFIQQKCHVTLSLHFYRLSLANDWVMCPPSSSLPSLLCRIFSSSPVSLLTKRYNWWTPLIGPTWNPPTRLMDGNHDLQRQQLLLGYYMLLQRLLHLYVYQNKQISWTRLGQLVIFRGWGPLKTNKLVRYVYICMIYV